MLILLLLIIGGSRFLLSYIAHYKPEITQIISDKLQQPAEIGHIKAYWAGLNPEIELNDFVVFNHQNHAELLRVNKIKLSVGLIASLRHQKIIPTHLMVQGGQIIIRQSPNKEISINGISIPISASNNGSNDLTFYKNINYDVHDVDLIWHGDNDKKVLFHNLKMVYEHNQKSVRSDEVEVNLPSILAKTLIFDSFSGDVALLEKENDLRVDLSNIKLINKVGTLQGKMNINFSPNQPDKRIIELIMDFSLNHLDQLNDYISKNKVSTKLVEWCGKQCVSGDSIVGQIFIKGSINQFPFSKSQGYIRADATVNDANFNFSDGSLALLHVNGKLHIDYPDLKASEFEAVWLGNPIHIDMTTSNTMDENSDVYIKLNGSLPIAELVKIKKLAYLKKIMQGKSLFKAQLQFSTRGQQNKTLVTFDSDLQGISVTLPQPLKKSSTAMNPSHVNLVAVNNKMTVTANYEKKLSVALILNESPQHRWNITSGNVVFGRNDAALIMQKGIVVHGNIPNFDLLDIFPYLNTSSNKSSSTNSINIKKININFDQLQVAGYLFKKINLDAASVKQNWLIRIKNHEVDGQIRIPSNLTTRPILIDFNRFGVAYNDIIANSKKPSSGKRLDIKPGDIPSLNILFKRFYLDKDDLGRIQIVTTRHNNTMVINQFSVSSPEVNLLITGLWEGTGNQITALNGNIKATNFGEFLNDWEITDSLAGGKGSLTFKIFWPGPLYKVNLEKLNGHCLFSLDDGVILDVVDSKIDLLGKMLNLVSIDTLEHLFSQPFDLIAPKRKGFDFKVNEAKFDIINGTINMDQFYLDGRLAKIKTQGDINLPYQYYNLYITINPLLTAFLPKALALAGGPAVLGAIWVVDKIMDTVLAGFLRQTYHITGPWTNPHYEKVANLPKKDDARVPKQSMIAHPLKNSSYKQ